MTTNRPALRGFLSGVLLTQFVNSALHLAQPLLMADLTGSIGHAALFSSFDTAVHTCGTFLGGWPVDRLGARRLLVLSTFLRGIALAAIPLALLFGSLSVFWAMAWYTIDAFVRGFADTAAYTLPLELAKHDAEELDRLNSRFEFVFDLGGIAGPLVLTGLMVFFHGPVAHGLIPVGFFASAMAYATIPAALSVRKAAAERTGSLRGFRTIFANPALLITCVGYMSFNIYPLRKLLGAFFAKSLLHRAPMAGTVGSAFALGGLVGALAYERLREYGSASFWIAAGAAGMITLGFGWLPRELWFMCAAAFVFAFTNVCARLSLTRTRQQLTPLGQMGGVTAASRFCANLVSVGIKALVGVAFTLGAGPDAAFTIVGISLASIALGQFFLAAYLAKRPGGALVP
ncbi:MAG: MFS transporter, partial [Bdellovibrionota bacterium]